MADLTRPATFLGKLQFAQRAVKGAQFRADPKQAVRELCEGMYELIVAMLEREEGREMRPEADPAKQKPGP